MTDTDAGAREGSRRRRVAAGAAAGWVLALAAAGCSSATDDLPAVPLAYVSPPPPPRPAACRSVAPGRLAAALATAAAGEALCLEPGEHPGPISVPAGVTMWGPSDAVVRSRGSGVTVRLAGAGAALMGVTVAGSGRRFDLQDAAVHVVADDVRVEGVRVTGALFGIIVERANRVVVAGTAIDGGGGAQIGMRGDGIRLWETRRSRIVGNAVVGARDVVVWYSSENLIEGNEIRGGRYGVHFMYSHDNTVRDNRFVGNVVGLFAMYSRGLAIERNLFAASAGAAGIGLGLKESSGLVIADNVLVRDAIGVYVDRSPFEPGSVNRFEGNAIRLCDTAIAFHSSVGGSRFLGNSLRGNDRQVRVDGGGDALANEWSGNDFDDYAGYDFDRDGVGDVPYELVSLSGTLAARYPQLDFWRGAPALALVDAASHLAPLRRPQPMLRDPRPRTTLPGAAGAH